MAAIIFTILAFVILWPQEMLTWEEFWNLSLLRQRIYSRYIILLFLLPLGIGIVVVSLFWKVEFCENKIKWHLGGYGKADFKTIIIPYDSILSVKIISGQPRFENQEIYSGRQPKIIITAAEFVIANKSETLYMPFWYFARRKKLRQEIERLAKMIEERKELLSEI
jgi:hypothetical protein